MKCFLGIIVLFLSVNAMAEQVYYLNTMQGCKILAYGQESIVETDTAKFTDVVLNVKALPKNPSIVAFKLDEKIYLTRETCVVSVKKEKVKNELNGHEYKKKPKFVSEQEKFNSYKYFIEFDTGLVKSLDQSQVPEDYNQMFASPTLQWGESVDSEYKSAPVLSFGFGFRSNQNRFLAFKFRMLSGKKTDTLSLTDVGTGISQTGSWSYADNFKNFYVGYKFIFLDYSAWKPVIAGYIGVSQMTSTATDGVDSFELSSIGPAALIEAGLEYHLNSHWGLGANFGFEYLGTRSMKFKDETMGTNFKTKMSYTNQYLSLGVKYYFK